MRQVQDILYAQKMLGTYMSLILVFDPTKQPYRRAEIYILALKQKLLE